MQPDLDILHIPLTTKRYNNVSDLDSILHRWNELAAGEPMRTSDWLLSWWEIYASPDDELCILTFSEPGGNIVGLAPLYLAGKTTNATYRFLGTGYFCTQYLTWLTSDSWEVRVGIEVARFLIGNKSDWKRLYLELIDAEALAVNATVNFLAENRFLCHKRQVNSNWKIHLPVNWEDYTRLLSKSLRKRCKKLQKQFLDSGEIVVRQVEKEEDLPEGWKVLLKLHTDRWKNDLKPLGIFSDERFLAFHKKVSSILFRQGKLRLAWLEHNNIPLAVEYQFMGSKTLYAYQAGIDLSNDLFSVGKLSIMTSIQFAILNGCVFFDLLNGNDPYKLNWRATPVDCHDFRVWHNRGMGRLEWGLWSSYSLAVHYLKPILPHRFIISMLTALHKSKDFVRLRFKKTQAA